jgi:hypothetical protein
MKLEAENSPVLIDVNQAQLVKVLKKLKSYGRQLIKAFQLYPLKVTKIPVGEC